MKAENDEVANLLQLQGLGVEAWIGLYQWPADQTASGWTHCTTGQEVTLENWGSGYPKDNRGRLRDCAGTSFSLGSREITWKDETCYSLQRCLCKLGMSSDSADYLSVADELHRPNRWKASALDAATRWTLLGFLVILPLFTVLSSSILLICCCGTRLPCCQHRERMDVYAIRTGDTSSESMLAEAERSAAALRSRQTTVGVVLGCFFFGFGMWPIMLQLALGVDTTPTAGAFQFYSSTAPLAIVTGFITVRPTDAQAADVASATLLVFYLFFGFIFFYMGLAQVYSSSYYFLTSFLFAGSVDFCNVLIVMGSFGRVRAICRWPLLPTRTRLRVLWLTLRINLIAWGLCMEIGIAFSASIETNSLANFVEGGDQGTAFMGVIWLLAGAALTPSVCGRMHRWMGEVGNKHVTKESEAAAIASLVGGGGADAASAVATAKARFRGLPLSMLGMEDMQSNKPAPELFAKTELKELGKVELFVSHSWSGTRRSRRALSKGYHLTDSRSSLLSQMPGNRSSNRCRSGRNRLSRRRLTPSYGSTR